MKLPSKLKHSLIAVITLLLSCENYLEVSPPVNKLDTHSVFSDSISASSAIAGIYADMLLGNNGFVASQVRWAGLYSDELIYNSSSDPILQYLSNNLHPDNSNNNTLWVNLYRHIYQANSVIEKAEASDHIRESAKRILIGESRFIRSLLYFYAVNNWGDIPLIVSTDYRINENIPRTPASEVYKQITDDLIFAAEVLSPNYITSERTRPNKYAAIALLSRVYLYMGEWEKSIEEADKVINSEQYRPVTELDKVFLKDSPETIFQFSASTNDKFGDNTYDAYYFVPSSLTNQSIPTYITQPSLLASFNPEDERINKWIARKEINGTAYYFPYKYKKRSGRPATEYTIVFRLSEQYLIRAEALARKNKLLEAIQDLNIIRNKAGLSTILPNQLDQNQILNAIDDERRHELFCEWGHRWFDLKRTGNADRILSPLKGSGWQLSDILWPIPLQQLVTNPNLKQNDGYQ